jgi:CHAD domain-containing protein
LDILPQLEIADRPDADRPIKKVAGARVAKDYRKLVRLGRAAQAVPSPEAFHELRKRGKDLRYFLEFFADLYPKRPVKTLLSELKSLHGVLGGFHDRAVQQQILEEIAAELTAAGSDAAPLLAIGGQMQQMLAAQAGAEAKFDKRFAEFSSKKQRALVKTVFA